MTPLIDLMPPVRKRARLVRRRVRQWTWIVALAASVVLPVAGFLHESVDPGLMVQRDAVMASLKESRARLHNLEARYEGLAHRRRVSDLIAQRPEYTRLINAIAGVGGDQISLNSIAIDRSSTPGGSAHAMVTIDGFAQSQVEAQQLVVRLEDLDIYRSVSLARTLRRPTEVGDLVSFRIVAVLRGGAS